MKKFLSVLLFLVYLTINSQESNNPLKVFIDCTTCGNSTLTMVKQELKQVDFVRDQTDSDVHVSFTTSNQCK